MSDSVPSKVRLKCKRAFRIDSLSTCRAFSPLFFDVSSLSNVSLSDAKRRATAERVVSRARSVLARVFPAFAPRPLPRTQARALPGRNAACAIRG